MLRFADKEKQPIMFKVFLLCHRDGSSLEEVVEKQADLIEYLKQHNSLLSKRLLNLTAQHWPQPSSFSSLDQLSPSLERNMLLSRSPGFLTLSSPPQWREGIFGSRNSGWRLRYAYRHMHLYAQTESLQGLFTWAGQITQEELCWKWSEVKEARRRGVMGHRSEVRGFYHCVVTPSDLYTLPLVLLWEAEEATLFKRSCALKEELKEQETLEKGYHLPGSGMRQRSNFTVKCYFIRCVSLL